MKMEKITESASHYRHLEKMSVGELLESMNKEDRSVPAAVAQAIPQIEPLIKAVISRLGKGGRLFYIGAGTSGRLGVLDASECPPTYGVPDDMVVGVMAGGDFAIRNSVEEAEDVGLQAWVDLQEHQLSKQDIVIGITASGTTPYVLEGLKSCREHGVATACISCNPDSPVALHADFPVEVVVGPEFVTGSTRMKAGTAQKLVLNMISTSTMIQLGRVMDNKMVDMQLTNEKLINRGTLMLVQALEIPYDRARDLLLKSGSVRRALDQ